MKTQHREISYLLAFLPLISMMIFIVFGHLIFEVDLKFILLISSVVAGVVAYISGVKVLEMIEEYAATIKNAFPAILILLAIGGIVGTWMFSGTVPYLIYYGLKLLNPNFVLLSAFVVTALVSTFTGTSWGSAATSGVAFMGIGASMGIPLPMIAGAALSGAVFGDKVSPVSDTTNLCALASNVSVYDHIRGMLPNVVFSGIIAAIGFTILGLFYSGTTSDNIGTQQIISDLDRMYNFNLFMMIPAAIVFIGGYKGYNPVVLMTTSCLSAILIGVLSNGFSPADGAQSMISGFNVSMINVDKKFPISEELLPLLNRGGFNEMASGAVLYCILAIAFGAFMHASGALNKLMSLLLKTVKSMYGLILTTFAAGGFLNGLSGNAAFSILTVGQLFKEPYEDKGLPLPMLSRSMENSMTLLESLLPWHVTAVYMTLTLGVSTMDYLPFTFFNISGICLFFVLSWYSLQKGARLKK